MGSRIQIPLTTKSRIQYLAGNGNQRVWNPESKTVLVGLPYMLHGAKIFLLRDVLTLTRSCTSMLLRSCDVVHNTFHTFSCKQGAKNCSLSAHDAITCNHSKLPSPLFAKRVSEVNEQLLKKTCSLTIDSKPYTKRQSALYIGRGRRRIHFPLQSYVQGLTKCMQWGDVTLVLVKC